MSTPLTYADYRPLPGYWLDGRFQESVPVRIVNGRLMEQGQDGRFTEPFAPRGEAPTRAKAARSAPPIGDRQAPARGNLDSRLRAIFGMDEAGMVRALCNAFDQLSMRFYGGAVARPGIHMDQLPEDLFAGCGRGAGTPFISISASLLTGRHPCTRGGSFDREGLFALGVDCLAHELAHLVVGPGEGHGPAFLRECKHLAGMMAGFELVPGWRRRLTADTCTTFPCCVRPLDFYRGAVAFEQPFPAAALGAQANLPRRRPAL